MKAHMVAIRDARRLTRPVGRLPWSVFMKRNATKRLGKRMVALHASRPAHPLLQGLRHLTNSLNRPVESPMEMLQ